MRETRSYGLHVIDNVNAVSESRALHVISNQRPVREAEFRSGLGIRQQSRGQLDESLAWVEHVGAREGLDSRRVLFVGRGDGILEPVQVVFPGLASNRELGNAHQPVPRNP